MAKRTALSVANKRLEEHQQKKPDFTEEDSEENLNSRIEHATEQIRQNNLRSGAITQELQKDAETRNSLAALRRKPTRRKQFSKNGISLTV